ncbi:choice-of-anchor D domain-containing protein [Parafrankia sp. EAN1pec]|uniref:choice-of-anchor D domain-containing protein n=1 Tax=Parafrankia sp. (strain EAN1pec) TaxID=298653 RepID=UPI00321AFB04
MSIDLRPGVPKEGGTRAVAAKPRRRRRKDRTGFTAVARAGRRRAAGFLLAVVVLVGASACQAEYKPPFAPIVFAIDENGNIDVSASRDLVTPIGTFTISESVALPRDVPSDRTLMILRHKVAGELKDAWFTLLAAVNLHFSVDGANRLVPQAEENVALLEVTGPATGVVAEATDDDSGDRFESEQVEVLPEVPEDTDPSATPDDGGPSGGPSGGSGEPGIEVTPETLSCDDSGCAGTVTVESTGTGTLRVTSTEIIGPDADAFSVDAGCEAELPPGGQCTLSVGYVPLDSGEAAAATLVIHQNLSGPANEVNLEGSAGTTPPGPEPGIAVTPETVFCTSSACQPVTVESTGDDPLAVTSVEIVGSGAAAFSYTSDCEGASLPTGARCVVTPEYTPQGGSDATATLVIHHNLAGPATEVTLSAS